MYKEGCRLNEIGYMDCHTHILPGVDDGAENMLTTKKMLQRSYQQGVRTIIATPHNNLRKSRLDNSDVLKLCNQVNRMASDMAEDFRVIPGNEVFYRHTIVEEIKEGKILPLGDSKVILVEFFPEENFRTIYEGLYRVCSAGYTPLIAHVERIECLLHNRQNVINLVEMGCYMQTNCECYTGICFNKKRKIMIDYIRSGLIHFLGSDCHNLKDRSPDMRKCINRLHKKVPKEMLDNLLYKNQSLIARK